MQQEPGRIRAGVYALLVHLVFVALLVFGVHWQNRPAAPVAVELWDSLPPIQSQKAVSRPKPEPRPEVKPEPRPEPKPKAQPEPRLAKPDIALKAKEKEKEARRRDEELKKAAEEKRREQERQKQLQALQQMQQKQAQQAEQMRAQQQMANAQAAAQARQANDYKDGINNKIKRLINNQACLPLGNPEARFDVTLLPTGELVMDPKLVRSSGSPICDQAIERAILRAQPLPVPKDPVLFSQFRELHLKFRPNENE